MTQESLPPCWTKQLFARNWQSHHAPWKTWSKIANSPAGVRVAKHVYWSELAVRKWQRLMFASQEAWQP